MHVQSTYPYELSETNLLPVSWLFDELSDNNVSEDRLSLSSSVAGNEQISKVILMLGSNAILVAYQINTRYNTYVCDDTFCHTN